MMTRLAAVLVVIGALAASACSGTSREAAETSAPAQAVPAGPTLEVVSPTADPRRELARRYGAESTAKSRRVARRLDLEHGVIPVFSRRVSFGERHRFGGLYIRHRPSYGVVVLLTSGGLADIRPYIPERLRGRVVVRRVERRLAQLRAMQRRVLRLRSVVSFDSSTNVHLNRVEIGLIGPTRAALEAATRALGNVAARRGEPLPAWVTVVGTIAPIEATPGERPDYLLTHAHVGGGSAMLALIGGVLELDPARGCVLLSGQPAVWPAGTRVSRNPPRLHLPGGETVRPGDTVRGGGGHVPRLAIRGSAGVLGNADEAFACATQPEVMVFAPRAGSLTVSRG
jgi:hypothetical protein